MVQTGQETIIVNGPITEISFMAEKTRQINAATQKLAKEGKEIVNIVESLPTSVLGLKTQEIRIIWKKPDKPVTPVFQAPPSQPQPTVQEPDVKKQFENVTVTSENFDAIVERIHIFLEDEEWERADYYCEQALNFNPKLGTLYLCKLMAELHVKNEDDLKNVSTPFDSKANCIKAGRYDPLLAEKLSSYNDYIREARINREKNRKYEKAVSAMKSAKSESEFRTLVEDFSRIKGFKNADKLRQECLEKAETARIEETYEIAVVKMSDSSSEMIEGAIALFESIIEWKDSREKIEECKKLVSDKKKEEAEREAERKRQEELAEKERIRKAEEARIAAEKKKALIKKTAMIGGPVVVALIVFIIMLNSVIIPSSKYNKAVKLADAGEYGQAINAFEEMGDYKDAKEKIQEIKYNLASDAKEMGDIRGAVSKFGKIILYKDSREQVARLQQLMNGIISAGDGHTIGLRADGTVVATEFKGKNYNDQCNVEGWTDIVAVSAGNSHTVGLRSDGTVVATGKNDHGQCDVDDWTDIVAVSAGSLHTVGLRADGTVVATGWNDSGRCDVDDWTDIIAVSAGDCHTVGLRTDGTVVATGWNGSGRCNVNAWKNIVAVSAGGYNTVGLRADGTVVVVGSNDYGERNVKSWTDIVAVSAGERYIVGLRADGTIVATGDNRDGQCDVDGWTDIVAVSTGFNHTVGLCADGTVIATGSNGYGKSNVDDWKDMKLPNKNIK